MIHTHTSDAAIGPNPELDGPLHIRDPQDPSSYVNIDPAQGRIAATGHARPTRQLMLAWARDTGATAPAKIGYAAAIEVKAGASGGFCTTPLAIPDELDVTEPVAVAVLVAPISATTHDSKTIRFTVDLTRTQDGAPAPTLMSASLSWETPKDWNQSPRHVVVATFRANTFAQNDIVAFTVRRDGTSPHDTFGQAIAIAPGARFTYVAHRL